MRVTPTLTWQNMTPAERVTQGDRRLETISDYTKTTQIFKTTRRYHGIKSAYQNNNEVYLKRSTSHFKKNKNTTKPAKRTRDLLSKADSEMVLRCWIHAVMMNQGAKLSTGS